MKKTVLVALGALVMAASPVLSGAAWAKSKIVVSMARVDDTFTRILRQSLDEAAGQHADIDIVIQVADNDSATQIKQVKDAIAAKADAVVILTVDTPAAEFAASETARAGVPLVFLNRLPPMDRFDGEVAIVASNDLVAGRLQMRIVAKQIADQGNVVILRGEDSHPAARDRTAGVKEIIAAKPGLKIAHEATGNWRRDQAETLITQWLDGGTHIHAIVANNDDMALGAIDALKKRGFKPGQVAVGGVDGTTEALEAIRTKWMAMSVLQNAEAQAIQALQDAAKFARDEYAQLYDWVPYQVIIPSNVDQFAAK